MATCLGKSCELFIRFTASAFCKLLSIYVFSCFLEGRMWDLIASVPDHCLSFYFTVTVIGNMKMIRRSLCLAKDAYIYS